MALELFLFYRIFLFFSQALEIAVELGDRATEAQACYSLGNTFSLLHDYGESVKYHIRHLEIARELNDQVGEARACWSLGNAHSALGSRAKALYFIKLHLHLSRAIGDPNGEAVAQENICDLQQLLGSDALPDPSGDPHPVTADQLDNIDVGKKKEVFF